MKRNLGATDEQVQSLKDYASELQNIGVIGDEVQLSGLQELSTYVENADNLKPMMSVLTDMLAQQYGLNATAESAVTISTMLGKVLGGQTSALSRYGYFFDEAQEKLLKFGTEEQRVATLAEVVSASVGGVNEALAKTDAGRMKQLSNTIGDIKEQFGDAVTQIEVIFLPALTKLAERLAEIATIAQNTAKTLASVFRLDSEESAAVSKNIAESVDNQNALTEAVSETEKAQKGSLAAFDQLNILTSKNDDDTDDTGNSENVAIVPTVSENVVEKAADDLKKRLENLLEPIKIAWDDESPTIIENAKRAVNAIKSLILSIGESIEEVFTNGSGEQLVRNILKIFGNLLGIIGDIAIALDTAWNSGGTGTALVQSYIDLWIELTGIVNDFIEDLRAAWNDGTGVEFMGKILKIVTNINRFASNLIERFREAWNENKLGRKIISGIFALFNRVADMIVYCAEAAAEWAGNINFAPLLEAIYGFVQELLPYWNILCRGVETLFTKVLLPCLKYLIENLLPAMFDFLAWFTHTLSSLPDMISGIFNFIGGLINGVISLWESVKEAVSGAVEYIWNIFESLGEWLYDKFSEAYSGITAIFSPVTEWFTGKFTEAYNGVTGIFSPIGDWFGDRWENIKEKFEIVGAWFRECFAVAVNYINEVFTPIVNFFSNIWEKIKAIFAKVASWFGEKFKAAWDKITAVFDKAKEYFSTIWSVIKGVFAVVVVWFEDKFQQAWDKITGIFDGAKAYFSAVWEGIKMIFSHVTDWFRDKFTEAWEAVKYVFSNGGAIFDGIVDGIFNVFRDIVNGLIFGINCVIWEPFNAINAALDGIRGVEIMGFAPFEWLPYINIPQIPYLAQGTVVPANYGNFLAVLGDNKREAEVVSPISSIEKAVENVLSRYGMPKELTINTYLYPNSAAYHREIIKIVNDDNRRKGQ